MNINSQLNQSGSTMVIALMLVAFLTLIGLSAVHTSRIEVIISANDRMVKQNFYLAEAATMEGAQALSDERNRIRLRNRDFNWLNPDDDQASMGSALWDHDGQGDDDNAAVSDVHPDGSFSIVDRGIPGGLRGGELGLENPSVMHEFAVFGRGNIDQLGKTTIEIGYRKRI